MSHMTVPVDKSDGTKYKATVETVYITPDLAKQWTSETYMPRNRTIRTKEVERYARDMKNGTWEFLGDPIRWSTSGILLDGQHRLRAIVKSGVPQWMLVVFGLPEHLQNSMDTGVKRSTADQLRIAGYQNSTMLGAITPAIISLSRGVLSTKDFTATKAEVHRFVEQHPEVTHSAAVAHRISSSSAVPRAIPSGFGVAHFFCAGSDKAAANEFFNQIQFGEYIGSGDPAFTLRRKFAEVGGANRRIKSDRFSRDETIRFTFMAWNKFRDGKKVHVLNTPPNGWNKGNFPFPK